MSQFRVSAICAVAFGVLTSCAGSSPDFSARTANVTANQNQLASWLKADSASEDITQIAAPICESTVGHPANGWAISENAWCVVACPVSPPDNVYDRWMLTHDELRCYATKQAPGQLVNTQLDKGSWDLDSQLLFEGFDLGFVRDTMWECEEQEYQIDPQSRQGFWTTLKQAGNTYSFYNDGALMVGRAGSAMKFAGDWRPSKVAGFASGVVVNDQEMFRYAVNYGGGRFDEFRSATRKQVCRFKDSPGPRL